MPTALVLKHLENLSREMIEEYRPLVARYAKGKCGIYALYKGNAVYYVGLASNLNSRLKHHLDDRHKGEWDRFSMYLIRNDAHLRELEALMHRVIRPEGNRQIGKLRGSEDLRPPVRRNMLAEDKARMGRLFGERVRAKRVPKPPELHGDELPAAGLTERSVNIVARYKGYEYTARLRPSGLIRFDGKTYDNPSSAAAAIRKCATNGWWMWQIKNKNGEWVRLRLLRDAKARER